MDSKMTALEKWKTERELCRESDGSQYEVSFREIAAFMCGFDAATEVEKKAKESAKGDA